ncbi:MAG: O-antigen ligase family protein, partial [Elusimicrobiota bacterium]
LFGVFIVLPFFRVFDQSLLSNIHIVIAVLALAFIVAGLFLNRLERVTKLLLNYLIPLAISSIAIHFFLKTYDSAQIKITLLETVGPIILIVWIVRRLAEGTFAPPPNRKYAVYPALLFLLSGILSFAFSQFKLETFEPGLLRRISYIGVFLAVVYEYDRSHDFKRIMQWVLASCLLITSYGLIQYGGFDWHIWAGAFGDRIFSTFGNPNFLGAWLVLVFPLAIVSALLAALKERWYYFGLILFLVLLMLLNAAFTYTMGSWIGIAAATIVFVLLSVLYLIKGDPRLLKGIAGGIIVSMVLITISGVFLMSQKRPRSITFRLFTWGAAIKMISEPIPDFASPARAFLFGHGIESFNLVYPAYRRPEIFHLEGRHNTQTDHAHNEYLEVFFDEGVLGLVIFLWLLTSIYYAGFKRLSLIGMGSVKSDEEYYLLALMAGTLGMLIHAALDVNPRFVSSGFILWVFLALIVIQSTPLKKDSVKKGKNIKENFSISPFKFILTVLLLSVGIYQSVLAHRRFRANIYHNQAIALSKQRRWDEATEYYHRVQENHPSFIMAYYFEGNVYNDRLSEAKRRGDEESAEMYYEQAIETYSEKVRAMYPNYVQLHFQEGMLHMRSGNFDKALKSFRRYLNIVDPVYTHTYFRVAEIYARDNNVEKALWYMQEATRRKPEDKEAYINLANLYKFAQKYDRVEETYLRALENVEKNQDRSEIARQLAAFYREIGLDDKAIELLENFDI